MHKVYSSLTRKTSEKIYTANVTLQRSDWLDCGFSLAKKTTNQRPTQISAHVRAVIEFFGSNVKRAARDKVKLACVNNTTTAGKLLARTETSSYVCPQHLPTCLQLFLRRLHALTLKAWAALNVF